MPLGAAAKEREVNESSTRKTIQRIGEQCNSPVALWTCATGVHSRMNIATNKKAVRARRTASETKEKKKFTQKV
jgi:hypothetical protein